MKRTKPNKSLLLIPLFKILIIHSFSLLLVINPVFSRFSYSQTLLSVKLKNVSISDLFSEIEQHSSFVFFYEGNLDLASKVTVSAKDETLTQILDKVLPAESLSYTINDNQVIVVKNEAAILASSNAVAAGSSQQKTVITGVVTDKKDGVTLPGVTVRIEGDTKAVVTDHEGRYSIDVNSAKVLVFSFIGMVSQRVTLTEATTVVNVQLESESEQLEDAVVVGFGSQKRTSVIGAVDNVKAEKLKLPTRTISTSLAGRLAGIVAVQSSGEPGYDGATFWIRGVNTFSGSQTPLILVDGVERTLDDIDTDEIADFTTLKDATATAVFGVRGANGVVLITTKKGTPGKPRINLRIENAFVSPTQLPEYVDAPTYMRLGNEARRNAGELELYSASRITNTVNKRDIYYYPDTDWMGGLLKDYSTAQKVNLNVSGGGEKMRYFVAGAFMNQDGIFKDFKNYSFNNNINVKRYNFRSNVDMDITNTTVLGIKIAGILEDRNYPGTGTPTIFSTIQNTPSSLYPMYYPDRTKIPGVAFSQGFRNPYQLLAHSGYNSEYYATLQSNINLNQDLSMITEGLRAQLLFSFDTRTTATVRREMRPRPYLIKPFGFDDEGEAILTDADGNYNYVDQDPSNKDYFTYLKRSSSRPSTYRATYTEAQLNYNRNFGNHAVGLLALYNQSDRLEPSLEDIYSAVPIRHQGLTGRATYAFDNRYFAEFNFGYNGSENFSPGKRYGFFPAVAVGWVPTAESFMEFIQPTIDFMKIRVSHGQVGNDQIGGVGGVNRFAYLSRIKETDTNVGFGSNNGYGYGAGQGIDVTYYGNPDATWETATKTDIGLEIGFLRGFRLQADFFYEKRTNIWTSLSKIPAIYGYEPKNSDGNYDANGTIPLGGNVGEMENKGIDGFLEYNKMFGKDWTVVLKGTFSYSQNKVLKNGEEIPKYAYQSKIGRSYGLNLGYVAEGLFIDDKEVENSPSQSFLGGTPKLGDIRYKDVNEDGKIDDFDRVYQGNPSIPQISYGIGLNIIYKNIDFAVLLQGVSRVSFYAKPKPFNQIDQGNVYKITEESRWTEENQDLNARFPRLAIGDQNNNYTNSSWWLEDGSYIRLKQMEIGYTLPKKLMSFVGIKSARFYGNGLNLLTFSPFKWWDPEARDQTGSFYPPQRILNVGVEINF